ncbi:MAG: DUF417 family protein [Alphaproteobacteria bacterium]|nr:DUF417 family protein [Alphaproteobacteria bacterium]
MFSAVDRLRPGAQATGFIVTLSLATLLIWFGLMNISGISEPVVDRWLKGHMFLSGLRENKDWIMWALGGLQALAGLLIVLHSVPEHIKRYAYWFVVVWAGASLSLMFTNPVWIDELGGFPAIGAGQGIIKYVAIAGLALWCLGYHNARPVMLLGLILVLGWIGGMKFTMVEADGIEPLLKTSPVFNWWLPVYFTKMQASYVIGVIELIAVLGLTGYWWNSRLFDLGLLLSLATFIVTLSFLITFDPAWTKAGFPYLSSGGQFLLKDLPLLAATFVLWSRS